MCIEFMYLFGRKDSQANCDPFGEKSKEEMLIQELLDKLKAKGRSISDQIRLLDAEPNMPESLLKCAVCLAPYSKKNQVPMVGNCGHSICRRCVRTLLGRKDCPVCREPRGFRWSSKNFLAFDLLDQMNKFPSEEEEEEEYDVFENERNEERTAENRFGGGRQRFEQMRLRLEDLYRDIENISDMADMAGSPV